MIVEFLLDVLFIPLTIIVNLLPNSNYDLSNTISLYESLGANLVKASVVFGYIASPALVIAVLALFNLSVLYLVWRAMLFIYRLFPFNG